MGHVITNRGPLSVWMIFRLSDCQVGMEEIKFDADLGSALGTGKAYPGFSKPT